MAVSCSMLDSPCEFGFPTSAGEADSFIMDYVTFQKTSKMSCNLTRNSSNPNAPASHVYGFLTR